MDSIHVLNTSKNVLIAQEAYIAANMESRMRGLLGRASIGSDEALILKPCNSIHTFFMRFPIDVLFLDKDMKVVKIVQDMGPNRLGPIIWRSRMAIELSSGKISQTNTQVGDTIELK